MPTNDKNQSQDQDRSRQGSNQMNQASNQGSNQSTKQQAGSTDRDTQSGLSGKSGSDDTIKKDSGSRSDRSDSDR